MGKKHRTVQIHSIKDSAKKLLPCSQKKGQTGKLISPLQHIPHNRLRLFRLIALIFVPALFFILLEMALLLTDYGYPTSATIREEYNGLVFFHDNPKFGYRFFSPALAREFTPFIFECEKSNRTYRIVILGESAAQGTPDPAFSFGRILLTMLRIRYPKVDFEVVTAAMPAINSHVVVEIAENCLRHQPDLFVVYTGNNEVVGPYGPGTVFSPFFSNLRLIRLVMMLKATKTAQLFTSLMQGTGMIKKTTRQWQGMRMFLDKQVRYNDPRLTTVDHYFYQNLRKISDLCNRRDIKIVFCTMGSNLKDCPPFFSSHRETLIQNDMERWNERYQYGVNREEKRNYPEAIKAYLDAAEIDSTYADLQFRMGRCYYETGQYAQARRTFEKAQLLDTNRFRPSDQINKTIRLVANESSGTAVLADVSNVFRENSPFGIPGNELFLDHVHMNFKGNYLLAQTVFKQIIELVPEWIKDQKAGESNIISDQTCAQHLVFNDLEQYKIADHVLNDFYKRPPFTDQLYHKETVENMERALDVQRIKITPATFHQAIVEYEEAIKASPPDWWMHWKYAELLASTDVNHLEEAARHFGIVKKTLPHYANVYVMLGLVMGKLGRFDESFAMNQKAIEMDPQLPEAYFNIGLACQMQRKWETAQAYYEKTLFIQPEHARAYNNLGIVYFRQGESARAIETLQQGLKLVPHDMELFYNLAIILNRLARKPEAIVVLRSALQINPHEQKILSKLAEWESGEPVKLSK